MTTTNKNFRVKNGLDVNGNGTFDGTVTSDALILDTSAGVTPAVGQLSWDADNETGVLGLNGVNLQIGQEHVIRVKNNSGSVAIPDRTLVMFAGATGDTVKVAPAITNNVSTYPSDYIVGITTEEIPADGFGFVTQFGFVNQVDTSSWTVGTLLYPDPANAGGFVSTRPAAPGWQTPIAAVTKQNASSGRIFVRAIPGIQLQSVENIEITSPANNDVLKYNLSTGIWENGTVGGSGTVTSVALSVPSGLSVSGSPITSSGTLDITYSSGYSIPLTASQADWDTAFGWGDHSTVGYVESSDIGSIVQAYDADLTSIAAITDTSGILQKTAANTWSLINGSFVVGNGTANIYYQTSQPSSPVAGDIWIDSDSAGSELYSFKTIDVTGSNTILADAVADTLTVTAGRNIIVSGNDTTDTLTIESKTTPDAPVISDTAKGFGYIGMPQNKPTISGTYSYTFQLSDAGKHFYATGTPSSATLTIPANSATAFEVGTTIVIINDFGAATNLSIAITTDTLQLAGTGSTGTRTLARYGMATIVKVDSTKWVVSGNGLT